MFELPLRDVGNRQVVWQMARADDLDSVIEDEDPDWGKQVIPVNQRVRKELFQHNPRNFQSRWY